jgi:hypothetical protein
MSGSSPFSARREFSDVQCCAAPEARPARINIFGFGIAPMIYVASGETRLFPSSKAGGVAGAWACRRMGVRAGGAVLAGADIHTGSASAPWNDIAFGLAYALALLGILFAVSSSSPVWWRPALSA